MNNIADMLSVCTQDLEYSFKDNLNLLIVISSRAHSALLSYSFWKAQFCKSPKTLCHTIT